MMWRTAEAQVDAQETAAAQEETVDTQEEAIDTPQEEEAAVGDNTDAEQVADSQQLVVVAD